MTYKTVRIKPRIDGLSSSTSTGQPELLRSVLVIYTGGTFGMVYDPKAKQLIPFDFEQVLDRVPELNRLDLNITILTLPEIIDSSNMKPAVWVELAQLIEENYHQYDSFVILHGTDTMAYTASALSFMLTGLNKPVILTGAQLPIGVARNDARENFITALEIAAAVDAAAQWMLPQWMLPQWMLPQWMLPQWMLPQWMLPQWMLPQWMLPQWMLPQWMLPQWMLPQWMLPQWMLPQWMLPQWMLPQWMLPQWMLPQWMLPQWMLPQWKNQAVKPVVQEVCVYFNSLLLRGNRSTKHESVQFNAFASENYPPLATAGVSIDYNRPYIRPCQPGAPLRVQTALDPNVTILKLFPGITQPVVESIVNIQNLRGVVLETFGAGNAPTDSWFLDTLSKAIDRGVVVFNVSQCDGGRVTQGRYQTSQQLRQIGVISGADITTEAAITKLMVLLGRERDPVRVRALLAEPLCGEMSD